MLETTTEPQPTVFVVDDDPSVRKALHLLIRSIGLPVESFAGGQEFLDAYDGSAPGCVVVDVRMPGMSGLELQSELSARRIDIPMIFITAHGDVPVAVQSLKAGAVDFVEKPFSDQLLLDALNRAMDEDRLRRRNRREQSQVREQVDRLTTREREVMRMVVAGKASKQIASDLQISQKTVEVHRMRIMKKLRTKCVADLVRMICRAPAVCA